LASISEVLADSKLARLDAEIFLAAVLQKSKTELFANPDFEISEKDFMRFSDLKKIRLAGKSVAAILNQKDFFGLDFFVNENVLTPRPETEILVEEVLKIQPKSLLDVGTGSGCLAISVKKNLPNCEVWGCDISSSALEVAQRNAGQNEVEVNFMESDLLKNIEKSFDVIVANLPYIPLSSTEVEIGVKKFEPNLALFGGADGLDLIRNLLTQISTLSQKPKLVLLEFGGGEQTEILEKFTKELFPNAVLELIKDLAGVDRVMSFRL